MHHCLRSSLSLKPDLFYFIFFPTRCLLLFRENLERSTRCCSQLTDTFRLSLLKSFRRSLYLGRKALTCLLSREVSGRLYLEGSLNRNSRRISLENDICLGLISTKERPLIILRSSFVSFINSLGSNYTNLRLVFRSLKRDSILGLNMIDPSPFVNFFSVRLQR